MASYDVVVIGAGVIGLSAAWTLARDGRSVAIVDPYPGRGASYVAAGMLAPVTEAAYGEESVVALALRSARAWPSFAASLEGASDLSVGYRANGTLLIGADAGDQAYLEALYGFQRQLGLASQWFLPSQARAVEPLLSSAVRAAIFAPEDAQVDNRRLLAALAEACRRSGASLLTSQVSAITSSKGCVSGVVADGAALAAPLVVLAAGHRSGAIAGFPADDVPALRPVKGQILRLRTPARGPALETTVRAVVAGNSVYVVPRADGQVVLGATVEEHADVTTTVGGAYALMRDALRVLPALGEYELVEVSAGLRPGSFDNAALVGSTSIDGLLLATGHYRNGILLAPVTSEILSELVNSGTTPEWAAPLSPRRFQSRVHPT